MTQEEEQAYKDRMASGNANNADNDNNDDSLPEQNATAPKRARRAPARKIASVVLDETTTDS
eukprot:CAMPEP_0116884076 /NCGR_PEP_ID=MMETSP0463-20121206/16803_1 /TAXON_ID=181622 /ORGANISM="Strombidinopsis sp, Strain SopsisLIS2011" /LENGTH=61 /DNA_ID=CAMNT_0004539889 /DNA_START=55 /DNA_END=240 /DNA_ORIENTATION=-